MGIIAAEAFYPQTYTTYANEISDLGATRPPDSVSYQPSSTIFNAVMIASGLMLLPAAGLLQRSFGVRRVAVIVGLMGIGVLGVGIFPGNRDPFHPLFAVLTFTSGGIAGVVTAAVLRGPFRVASRLLGAIALASLAIGVFGEQSVFFEELGAGGVERWVAYPIVLWLVALGGYLMSAPVGADPVSPAM